MAKPWKSKQDEPALAACSNPYCPHLSAHLGPKIARGVIVAPCSECGGRMVGIPKEESPFHNPNITREQFDAAYLQKMKDAAPDRVYGQIADRDKPWRKNMPKGQKSS